MTMTLTLEGRPSSYQNFFPHIPKLPVEILANLKKVQRILQCNLFYTEFDGEFNGASCQIFSLVQKKLSKNVDVDILCKIKFFMDNVLSVEVLKLAITIINCVEQFVIFNP